MDDSDVELRNVTYQMFVNSGQAPTAGICAALHCDGTIETACADCGDAITVRVREEQPDDASHHLFARSDWTERTRDVVIYVWEELQGDEPSSDRDRWLEVNECKYLFHYAQKWTRKDGQDFAVWNYLELSDA